MLNKFILFLFCILSSLYNFGLGYPFGEFVARCPTSHILFDDPIVFPNEPGRSHLHLFFGATDVNASTVDTCDLFESDTTCSPKADITSYWMPALFDPNGNVIPIKRATFYYQTRFLEDTSNIQPLPNGLKIIAGDAKATGPVEPRVAHWGCQGEGVSDHNIVQCAPGNPNLEAYIRFPECWDGVNLDSPDHKSHMSYAVSGSCPDSHPVPVPLIEFKILYDTRGGPGFSIASGPGYTLHADVFVAWQPGEQEWRVINCLRQQTKCDEQGVPDNGNYILSEPPVLESPCPNKSNNDTGDDGNTDDGDDGNTDNGDDGNTDNGDDGNTDNGDDGNTDNGDDGDDGSGDTNETDPTLNCPIDIELLKNTSNNINSTLSNLIELVKDLLQLVQ
jgi:hypothetical protein